MITAKDLHEIVKQLRDIRDISTMDRASFDGMWEPVFIAVKDRVVCNSRGAGSGDKPNVTDFIKEKTDLWRRSWLTGPLDEVIAELEKLTTKDS